jgi:lipid-binding SYLF domain-containing protein
MNSGAISRKVMYGQTLILGFFPLMGYYFPSDVYTFRSRGMFGVLHGRKGIHAMKIRSSLCSAAIAISIALAFPAVAAVPPETLSQPMGGEGSKGVETVQVQEPPVVEDIQTPPASPGTVPVTEETVKAETPAPIPPPVMETSFNTMAIDEISKINASTEVLQEITGIPEGISPDLLANAYGIVIIPGTIKLGFFFGGRFGTGIAMMRNENGTWSNPSFLYLGGGSFGLQFGALSSDIILVFKTRKSIMGLTKGNFTLGADAAVAAGPVGRRAEASTDWQLKAEIYSYARSRGFFAGISLDGSVLAIDNTANENFYGKSGIGTDQIFASAPSASPAVIRLKNFLSQNASALPKE